MVAQFAETGRTAATLFSGIGGDALGLERAGYRLLWFAETALESGHSNGDSNAYSKDQGMR